VECRKQADEELSIPSEVDTDHCKSISEDNDIRAAFNEETVPHDIFNNLSFLQCATMFGDVWLYLGRPC
jgi:hypothetical protein